MVSNQSEAEDALQDACRRAFECLKQFQGKGTFAGSLVENECSCGSPKMKPATFDNSVTAGQLPFLSGGRYSLNVAGLLAGSTGK